jgi:hypothetical protein
MISFKSYVAESFSIDGDELVIDYEKKSDTNNLRFGKGKLTPYVKKLEGVDVQVFSLYTFNDQSGTKIIKKLKANDISNDTYYQFLQRSAVFASRLIHDLKIDLIVLPESSSPLAANFARAIMGINPGIKMAPKNFIKARDVNDIKILYDHPKLTPAIIKTLESSLRRAEREGVLKMKWILPVNRKFLENVFSYDGNADIFEYRNVLIVDDVVTSGSSILPLYLAVEEAGASNTYCLTLFKATT